jgi:pimeloyl-ACP methyl ester carboxylesterase
MPLARVDNVGIRYEEAGRGRPLVLVHGFGVSAKAWEAQIPALSRRWRAITYDARGHGRSDAPEQPGAYSQPILVEDLRRLLGHLEISRACILGHSMGANVALALGLTHPELVDGLIICAAGSGSDNPDGWRQASLDLASLVEDRGIEAFADAVLAWPAVARYVAQGPEAAQRFRALLASQRPEGMAGTLRGVLATRPPIYALGPQLRSFTAPVLVVVGEHDQACLRPSHFMAETFPRAELVVLPGAGHVTPLEDPAAFNAAVERFLERLWG